MSTCTYRINDASGKEVVITGQADMKAFLADGGLEQLLPGKVLPWNGKNADADVSVPAAQKSGIDDFGAKLEGARKFAQASVTKEWSDDDIASQPFSKIWPATDIDAIADPFEAAVMFAARAEVPAKPRVAYKVKAWVEKVKAFRSITAQAMDTFGRNMYREEMGRIRALDGFRSKVALLEALDRSHWKRIGAVSEHPNAYTFNGDEKVPAPQSIVEIDGKRERFEGSGSVLDALDKIKEKLGVDASPKKMQFEVRGREGMYSINKKGDKEYRKLKTFSTSKEAFEFIKNSHDELVAAWDSVKDRDNVGKADVRNETNRPRTGSDWRGNLSKARALQALINSAKADAKFVSDSFIRVSRLSHGDGDVNVPRPFGSSDWPSLPGGVNPKLHERLSYMAAVSIHLLRNLSEAESFGVELLGKGNVPLISAVQEAMLALGHDDKVLRSVVERIPVDVMDFLSREKISAESLFRDKSVLQSFFPVEGSVSIRAGVRDNPIVRLVRETARGGAEVVGADDTARIALEDDSALLTGQFNSGLEKSLFSHDVTPDEFDRTFSFKGVQFGNWVNQGSGGKDRQGLLNQAYDALMDLADIVGIPPKAISLNGTLGLSFGARGSGWAAAHFEPGNLVINLTKTKGAGTLAHEWFHALDDYFSRQRGGEVKIGRGVGAQEAYRTQNFITYRPEPMYVHKSQRSTPITKAQLERYHEKSPGSDYYDPENWQIDPSHPQGVRPEVERAFADLIEALDNSPMKVRAAKNDKGADGYWSRIIERGARSFENYVIHKMRLKGYDNDYLANVRKVDDFPRDAGRYPYLLDEEVEPIAEAFDNLFAEVKTKETEQGVAMYEIDENGDPSKEEAEAVQRGLGGKSPIEAAAWLAENAPPQYAAIAEKVRDKLQYLSDSGVRLGMAIINAGDIGESQLIGARGVTIPSFANGRQTISIALNGSDMKGRVGTSYRTALHELVHAATLQPLDRGMKGIGRDNSKAAQDLYAVGDAVIAHLNERIANNPESLTKFEKAINEGRANFIQSPFEMIAWALSSNEAQSYLESIPYKSKTLWTAFVEAVRKILGLAPKSDTALSEVLRISEILLKPEREGWPGRVPMHGDGHYEIQQPGGGRVFKNPGGRPETNWSDGPAVLRTDYPDTQAFREWFGNSKMTNKAGDPLLFMHGSPASFEAFDTDKLGTSSSHTSSGLGHFFTRDKATAEKYADGGNIYTGWLKIEKPYVMMIEEAQAFDDAQDSAKRRKELQKMGYDGVVILDDDGKPWATVAFEPWQFKSTDNNGAFDEFDDRMRFRNEDQAMRDTSTMRYTGDVPRKDAEDFIRKFVAEYPGAPSIMLADSFDQLPESIRKDAIAQGSGPTRAKGALKSDTAYVVLNNHHSMADLEATIFHEILGHSGVRKMFGPEFSQELNRLFVGLGGYSGLQKIMEQRGLALQFHGYFDAIHQAKERNPRAWTDALAQSILTEEVFAHIAEQKNGKKLRDRFMALIGMVRDWLRRYGFASLADLGESDIVFLLQKAREGLREGEGVLREGTHVGEKEIVDADGRPVARESSPDYEALKTISGRLGLREREAPTVFATDAESGYRAGMDDENNVAGKQAPTRAGDVETGGDERKPVVTLKSEKMFGDRIEVKDGGRVHISWMGWGDSMSQLRSKAITAVMDAFRPKMPEGTYWRFTNNKSEVKLARARKLNPSTDHSSGTQEDGLSVTDGAHYSVFGYKYGYQVRGDVVGYGADGEPLLDVATLEPVTGIIDANQIVELDRKARLDALSAKGWTLKQYQRFANGTFSIHDIDKYGPLNEPSASVGSDAPAVLRTEFSAPEFRQKARDAVANLTDGLRGETARSLNWWDRTVGTQNGKAKKDADFGRVYNHAHAFLDGVSDFANRAADKARGILPHLDSWRDIGAGLNVRKQWGDSKDYQAISKAIFDGTLVNGTSGKVWSDEELNEQYGLNEKQIGFYREFRAAVDFSLETLAASEMSRLARASKLEVADRDMGMDDAKDFYVKQVEGRLKEARAAIDSTAGAVVARHMEERASIEDAFDDFASEESKEIVRNEMERRHKAEIDEVMKAVNDLEALRDSFIDKADKIHELQEQGYAPLMRFGEYTVDVVRLDKDGKPVMDEDGNPDRPFFGMFESEAEARKAEKALAEEYPGYTVTRGVLSVEASQLYRGLTPETAELFARMLGTDTDDAFQAYLKQAVANRSAMKRLIHRMGMEGFSNDVPRVLASFITSNARLSSGNWHFGDMSKAVEAIPKHKGDIKDEAIRLMQYVQNPQEEAAGLRGFLFFNFLGGSIASALVNLTQTFTTTLPYLNQFGPASVAKALPKAMTLAGKMMTKRGLDSVEDKGLREALQRAQDEGVVDPQEIHLLMAESHGNGASSSVSSLLGMVNKEWATPAARVTRAATQAWGSLFGAAEKYNRHVAFIAAWEVAPEGVDRYEFAKNAVTETQFDYTKASRPNWGRGAIGATLFTFKTFTISYLEFLSRLPSRERALAIAVLFLFAGMSGMPGADDLDDVIDTIGQKMGYNWNNAGSRHAWIVKTLGHDGANFVEHGISSMLPLDMSSRLSVANIAPGTAAFKKSNQSPAKDVQEFFGPAGSMVAAGRDVFDAAGSGKGAVDVALPILPKMFRDLRQAVDMWETGSYNDMKGRKVVDVSKVDALIKGVGFQPNTVAEPRRVERMLAQSSGMQRAIRDDIHELMARGRVEGDAEKQEAARELMRSWNEKNPDAPIRLNPASLAQRTRAMRLTSADRLVKATPKEMRGAIAAELETQR